MLDLEDYESTNEEVVESAPPPQPPKKKRRRYDNKMKRDAVKHCILDCKGNKLEAVRHPSYRHVEIFA